MQTVTWSQRYKIRNFVKSSLWLAPLASGVLAVICHRLVWHLDISTQWQLLGYSQENARTVISAISSAMLSFIVFLMSMIFIALQIAVGQLTPRIIAFSFRNHVIKISLSIFTFTYMFSISALGRMDTHVSQLVVLLTIISTAASIGIFLYFVDFMGKSLRPISLCAKISENAIAAIEHRYPALLTSNNSTIPKMSEHEWGSSVDTISNTMKSGTIMAIDTPGLVRIACNNNCMIRLIPQIGDFVANGDPLFCVYQDGGTVDQAELYHCLVFGVERAIEQDPGFAIRIIVDIAIKALSPAINDPTTSIACIDQLHTLLGTIGRRDLGDTVLRDSQGTPRFTHALPDWEDFVHLAVSEINHYGADSIQVTRRLRAMLTDLIDHLPEPRKDVIRTRLALLDQSTVRNFAELVERELAMAGDYKGIGGARQ